MKVFIVIMKSAVSEVDNEIDSVYDSSKLAMDRVNALLHLDNNEYQAGHERCVYRTHMPEIQEFDVKWSYIEETIKAMRDDEEHYSCNIGVYKNG